MIMNQASWIIPPAVSCLYSVMRRLIAVEFPALEFIGPFLTVAGILTDRRNHSKWWFTAYSRRSIFRLDRRIDADGQTRRSMGLQILVHGLDNVVYRVHWTFLHSAGAQKLQ